MTRLDDNAWRTTVTFTKVPAGDPKNKISVSISRHSDNAWRPAAGRTGTTTRDVLAQRRYR